jgi:hypothetical protein
MPGITGVSQPNAHRHARPGPCWARGRPEAPATKARSIDVDGDRPPV